MMRQTGSQITDLADILSYKIVWRFYTAEIPCMKVNRQTQSIWGGSSFAESNPWCFQIIQVHQYTLSIQLIWKLEHWTSVGNGFMRALMWGVYNRTIKLKQTLLYQVVPFMAVMHVMRSSINNIYAVVLWSKFPHILPKIAHDKLKYAANISCCRVHQDSSVSVSWTLL